MKTNYSVIENLFSLIPFGKEKINYLSPLFGSSKSFLIQHLQRTTNQIVVFLPSIQNVSELEVELNLLGIENQIISVQDFKSEIIQELLIKLQKFEKFVLISTYDLLNKTFPSKEILKKNLTKISNDSSIGYNDLLEYFNLLNYNKNKFVEERGEFSIRGSIIDFWSYSEKSPTRIEFDGDFIESIRYFNSDNQRSFEKINEVTIAGKFEESTFDENEFTIFDYLESPIVFASLYQINNFNKNFFLNEEIKSQPIIDDEFKDMLEEFEIPQNSSIQSQNKISRQNFKEDIFQFINSFNSTWIIEVEIGSVENKIDLELNEAPSINSNYERLFETLKQFSKENYKIFIAAENEIQANRLKDLLSDFKIEISDLIDIGILKVINLPVKEGFVNKKEKTLFLTDYQIFNKPYRTKLLSRSSEVSKKKLRKSLSSDFASIKIGDFVVHEEFGIGKYAGLETIKIGETEQESMKLLYNDGGVVYVNLNYLNLVKKFSAKDSLVPTLSSLGSADWSNTKKKTKKKIKEAARELIELYAKRKQSKGFSFSSDTVWQKELEASFIYEDTPDQSKVSEEVKKDMEAEYPMDRLVCGDVGFGKTEVAVRAAFKAVQDGMQAALLVPTTILAEQHFNTFQDRLSQFPIKVEVLSRFQSKSKQKEIIKGLADGKVDIVIGTHRLLSKDIQFRNLGLLIIDEEHRFGVMAKEKLKAFKLNVDILTLTATPIPRTLNLSLLGARDLSIIATPPPNRQPIFTKVEIFDIQKIRNWILKEVNRKGQIYFVHDRVESIEKFSSYIQKHISEIKIATAHGQMKAHQLEDVFHKFLNKNFDILVSTKIIESGLDIPNVNTIIINRADRFGLAELHQLRGRVGRSDKQAYAYLLVPSLDAINKNTLKRLQAIEEFTELGAGFNLSMRDLEIRGAGNLLGTEQSGFINEIGFDLYLKMINEAVEELKYEEFKELFKDLPKHKEQTDPSIDSCFDIAIPQIYMQDQIDRLKYYTMIYSIKSIDELEDIKEELVDKFGSLPLLVQRLFLTAKLKYFASHSLFERVIIQRKNIFIILPKGNKEDYYKYKFIELMNFILKNYNDKIKFSQQKDILKLVIENKFESPEKSLEFLIELSKNIMDFFLSLDSKSEIKN